MAYIFKHFGFNNMILLKIIIISIVLIYYPDDIPFMIMLGTGVIIWNLKQIKLMEK